MGIVRCGALRVILVSLCAAGFARAQSEPPQAEIRGLVTQYVAAFNAKDASRLEALYGSKALACLAAEKKDFKDYYDFAVAMTWRDSIPANYTFKVSAINQNNLKAMETFGHFPAKPAWELHINYQQGNDVGSVELYLIQENGRWLIDQLCASQATMKQFRDDAPARREREARYRSLAAGIQEPLRSQLIELLRNHDTGEATERYMKATGKDGQTAMLVMDELAHEVKR